MTKKSRPEHPLYPKHFHPWDLEPYYSAHVGGMTEGELHDKADIAEQLAWRDQRIAELETLARNLATPEHALRANKPAATETGPSFGACTCRNPAPPKGPEHDTDCPMFDVHCSACGSDVRGTCEACGAVPAPQGAPNPHRGSEFASAFTPEELAEIRPQGAPCLHTLNELGHCTRCGARPNDKPQGAPQYAPRFQGETCSKSIPKAGAEYGHLYTRGRCEWCNNTHPNANEVVK